MGLPEGKTNNRRGRPKGSKNKVNKELREVVKKFIERKLVDIDDIFDELQPRDKVKFIVELMSYSLPKFLPVEEPGEEPAENFMDLLNRKIQEGQ